LLIWEARTGNFIKRIGEKFFIRGVCAATFSHDTKYICAVGCDDRHTMGIWDVNTSQIVAEVAISNGIPPQIRSLTYCPEPQQTSGICPQHRGLNDVFVTTGKNSEKRDKQIFFY
jgi:WD40 repeat protein